MLLRPPHFSFLQQNIRVFQQICFNPKPFFFFPHVRLDWRSKREVWQQSPLLVISPPTFQAETTSFFF